MILISNNSEFKAVRVSLDYLPKFISNNSRKNGSINGEEISLQCHYSYYLSTARVVYFTYQNDWWAIKNIGDKRDFEIKEFKPKQIRRPKKRTSNIPYIVRVNFSELSTDFEDSKACSVMALSLACKVPYKEAFALAECAGRERYKGMSTLNLHALLEEECFGYKFKRVYGNYYKTVKHFLDNHSEKSYILFINKHVFYVEKGKAMDCASYLRHIVHEVYEVIKVK